MNENIKTFVKSLAAWLFIISLFACESAPSLTVPAQQGCLVGTAQTIGSEGSDPKIAATKDGFSVLRVSQGLKQAIVNRIDRNGTQLAEETPIVGFDKAPAFRLVSVKGGVVAQFSSLTFDNFIKVSDDGAISTLFNQTGMLDARVVNGSDDRVAFDEQGDADYGVMSGRLDMSSQEIVDRHANYRAPGMRSYTNKTDVVSFGDSYGYVIQGKPSENTWSSFVFIKNGAAYPQTFVEGPNHLFAIAISATDKGYAVLWQNIDTTHSLTFIDASGTPGNLSMKSVNDIGVANYDNDIKMAWDGKTLGILQTNYYWSDTYFFRFDSDGVKKESIKLVKGAEHVNGWDRPDPAPWRNDLAVSGGTFGVVVSDSKTVSYFPVTCQ